jgi:hypothetical protein
VGDEWVSRFGVGLGVDGLLAKKCYGGAKGGKSGRLRGKWGTFLKLQERETSSMARYSKRKERKKELGVIQQNQSFYAGMHIETIKGVAPTSL